ncbi:OmpA family protein [Nitrospira sp. Nam74]
MVRVFTLSYAIVLVSMAACQSQHTSSISTDTIPSLLLRAPHSSGALPGATERIMEDQVTVSGRIAPQTTERRTATGDSVSERRQENVYFDYDSARITEEGQMILREVANRLRASGTYAKATIEGHCDARGSEEYN